MSGAHDGFRSDCDFIALSITPDYLVQIGGWSPLDCPRHYHREPTQKGTLSSPVASRLLIRLGTLEASAADLHEVIGVIDSAMKSPIASGIRHARLM